VTGAVVALGLGVLVITAMALVETRLNEKLRTALPFDAPTAFMLDVQPKQWEGLRATLAANGASAITEVPVVTARLASVDGVDVAALAERSRQEEDPDRRSWMFTREQRITWMKELPRDNRIVQGQLWSDPAARELSVETEYAKDLGATLGSKIVFDIQGANIEFVVTSLRTVEWESFGVNFFLIAEPGALDGAPYFVLAAAKLDAAAEARAQDALAKQFPNVLMIRVRAILEKLMKVMARLAIGVRILGSFTILTGIVILAGVVSASTLHRAREVALLKTLGVTRGGVMALFAVEFALVGLVAGLIGAGAAFVLAWTVLDRLIELDAALPWWSIPLAALGTALLATLCGLLACGRALATRPIESLR
jgi:putative ABC transport system permease protein